MSDSTTGVAVAGDPAPTTRSWSHRRHQPGPCRHHPPAAPCRHRRPAPTNRGNGVPPMRKWLPLAAICLGAFILLVDVTIVNVALPSMASDLHASFSSLQWVMDVYALALAALLMVAGSLADLFGHRRLYVAGLIVFALASLSA